MGEPAHSLLTALAQRPASPCCSASCQEVKKHSYRLPTEISSSSESITWWQVPHQDKPGFNRAASSALEQLYLPALSPDTLIWQSYLLSVSMVKKLHSPWAQVRQHPEPAGQLAACGTNRTNRALFRLHIKNTSFQLFSPSIANTSCSRWKLAQHGSYKNREKQPKCGLMKLVWRT